jgi:hypothetical protein
VEYPIGSPAFFLGGPAYGSCAQVVSHDKGLMGIKVGVNLINYFYIDI